MSKLRFIFYQCKNPDCNLRFPSQIGILHPESCPRCGESLEEVAALDIMQESESHPVNNDPMQVIGLLDNIRSAWNVGSMFRTSDGFNLRQLYLCGITPTPMHPRVKKTSLGAERTVSWEYHSNSIALARLLITQGYQLWVLEDALDAVSLGDIIPGDVLQPLVLVVGNEICGVDPGLLEMADRIISIPMSGIKRSYNVAVAFGIGVSYLYYCHKFSQGSVRKLPNT